MTGLDAKYELALDDEGRKYWRCWLDGEEADPVPPGYGLSFPSAAAKAPTGDVVEYPPGTVVHITAPDMPNLKASQVKEVKERLVKELIRNDPDLTEDQAEALLFETLSGAKPTEFSNAIVKGTKAGA